MSAECAQERPAQVLGAGGAVNTFNGQVGLELSPFFSPPKTGAPPGASATGSEDETGNPANWSVTAYAICSEL